VEKAIDSQRHAASDSSMHKYQVTSATVLPIATDNIAGEMEEESIAPDRAGRNKPLKTVVGERIALPRGTSNSNTDVAFTPHAQQLQPIDGGHAQELTALANQEADTTATTPATSESQDGITAAANTPAPVVASETSVESKQTAAPQQKQPMKSSIPLRRMTVEMGGDKKPLRVQRKRSMSLQPTKVIELTKNYEQLVREFNMLRPFTRCPDGTYPRDTKCVICRRARPTSVFFPCQHRCVCDDCVASHRISADRSVPSNWWYVARHLQFACLSSRSFACLDEQRVPRVHGRHLSHPGTLGKRGGEVLEVGHGGAAASVNAIQDRVQGDSAPAREGHNYGERLVRARVRTYEPT
jgi:hypothetical protein